MRPALNVLPAALVLASLTGCFAPPPTTCQAESDCGATASCINGTCVALEVEPDVGQPGADGGTDSVLDVVAPGWEAEVVYAGEERGVSPTLNVTPSGVPFLAFQRQGKGLSWPTPMAATRSGASWELREVGPVGSSIAFFKALRGGSETSFWLGNSGSFYFAEWAPDGMYRYRLFEDPTGRVNHIFDAAMGADGVLHGLAVTQGKVRHLSWDGDRTDLNVTVEDLADPCAGDEYPTCVIYGRIWLNATGEPQLAYRLQSGEAFWGSRVEGQWSFQSLPASIKGGEVTTSVADEPTFCFGQEGALVGSGTLRCVRSRSGQWATLDLAVNEKDTEFYVHSAWEGAGGELRVLYSKRKTLPDRSWGEQLMLAQFDGSAWTETLVLAEVTTSTDGGLFVDSAGTNHLAVGVHGKVLYLRAVEP